MPTKTSLTRVMTGLLVFLAACGAETIVDPGSSDRPDPDPLAQRINGNWSGSLIWSGTSYGIKVVVDGAKPAVQDEPMAIAILTLNGTPDCVKQMGYDRSSGNVLFLSERGDRFGFACVSGAAGVVRLTHDPTAGTVTYAWYADAATTTAKASAVLIR